MTKDKKVESKRNKARYQSRKLFPKLNYCEKCNSTKNLHRHHEDYNKPELVNVLCGGCHLRMHNKKEKRKILRRLCVSNDTFNLIRINCKNKLQSIKSYKRITDDLILIKIAENYMSYYNFRQILGDI